MNGGTGHRRVVLDTATGRVGEVMDATRLRPGGEVHHYHLRPVGGGREWTAKPEDVRDQLAGEART